MQPNITIEPQIDYTVSQVKWIVPNK
jgi:hypothetical protein